MDTESAVAVRFIEGLGSVNARFTEFARVIRKHPKVVEASHSLECIKYDYGDAFIDGYIEASVRDGHTVAWLISVTWGDDHWTITSRIALNRSAYQEDLRVFPDRQAGDFSGLLSSIDHTVSELLNTSEVIDQVG